MRLVDDHYDAVKALIESDAELTVYPAVRLDDGGGFIRDAYVILSPCLPVEISSGRFTADALITSPATFIFDVTCVAETALMAGRVMERVLAQTLGQRPVISGRRVSAITLESADKVLPDATVKPPLFYGDMALRLVSRP